MIVEVATFTVVAGIGFAAGCIVARALRDDALTGARADRDLANQDAIEAQRQNDLACADAARDAIALARALAEATTLRLQLDAARVKIDRQRAAIVFWTECFRAAHLAFLVVAAAHDRVTASSDPADFGRLLPARGLADGAPS